MFDYELEFWRLPSEFFKWWPTHNIPGKRGVTVKGKSPSAKTMLSYWNSWNESAIFIYLHERHCCRQRQMLRTRVHL